MSHEHGPRESAMRSLSQGHTEQDYRAAEKHNQRAQVFALIYLADSIRESQRGTRWSNDPVSTDNTGRGFRVEEQR